MPPKKTSAGLLIYRISNDAEIEVLLVHPGGPFFRNKDASAWTIPKGEIAREEDPFQAAKRELREETGFEVPSGDVLALGEVRQKGGKLVLAWAVEADVDPATLRSNTFELEWPPRSGTVQEFPEVDRAAYFRLEAARTKINPAQVAFLDRLVKSLGATR